MPNGEYTKKGDKERWKIIEYIFESNPSKCI